MNVSNGFDTPCGKVAYGCLVLMLCFAANPLFPVKQTPGRPESARQMLGDLASDILQNPVHLSAARLDPKTGDRFDVRNIEGFVITAETVLNDPALSQDIRQHIASDSTYDFSEWGLNKWCGAFEPGVAFRLEGGQGDNARSVLLALICFKCDDVVYAVYDRAGTRVHATFVDFKPGRAGFLELALRSFPRDEVLIELNKLQQSDH